MARRSAAVSALFGIKACPDEEAIWSNLLRVLLFNAVWMEGVMMFVLGFDSVGMKDVPQVGGKNASLGEMITQLAHLGIKVPGGFATTANAYREFLRVNQLEDKIHQLLDQLNVDDVKALQQVGKAIRGAILAGELPSELQQAVDVAYQTMNLSSEQTVAVRSSATAEDLPEASFAGQQDTLLNVSGIDNIKAAIKTVYASLFTDRAIVYRAHHQFDHLQIAMSAGVQQMIRSDLAASGVMFTLDTESGFDQVVFITGAYGLGESIAQGEVSPDEFYVHKPMLAAGKQAVIKRKLGTKSVKMVYSDSQDDRVKMLNVDSEESQHFCLTDDEVLLLAKQALVIESHYGRPMDIEWAKDGIDHQLYMIQARPETVKAGASKQYIVQYRLTEEATPLVSGSSVGQKIGQGVARVIHSPNDMESLQPGEVLVAQITDPDWEPVMKRASAIVTNRGGRTCHAAIVARELGIPAIVGCHTATDVVHSGDEITVSCAEGETGHVYPGLIAFEKTKTEIKKLPKLPVKLLMNLANPEQAFTHQFLPNAGIGLARLEFIISNMIGMHPNALLNINAMPQAIKEEILKRTAAYASPVEYYIEKLAEGIATIAAAFYPKNIIVRFSDFKSNEYANLLGGAQFEPEEENPMLGYRGASRYVAGNFKPCFALECEAIKRVREQKGLTNTQVMFPFVRTIREAARLTDLIKEHGIERGKDGLKVYMMCEIPANALLAEQFLEFFDGYSIGSNDLTQLTLGLDRDSSLVAELFDERNAAVKVLLKQIISTCKRMNKYVGICGQGPSDHLDLAKWLVDEGIESLSLTPDTIVETWMKLGKSGA